MENTWASGAIELLKQAVERRRHRALVTGKEHTSPLQANAAGFASSGYATVSS